MATGVDLPWGAPTIGDWLFFGDFQCNDNTCLTQKIISVCAWPFFSTISFFTIPFTMVIGGPVVLIGFFKAFGAINNLSLMGLLYSNERALMAHTLSWIYPSNSS